MKIYTQLPEHKGELRFAHRLGSMLDDRAHAWFGINYLPGVKDIDLLLWHEEVGVFTIEVKAVSIEMIESFSFTRCKIQGRGEGPSPHAQAQAAEIDLRNYLLARKLRIFNIATAAFPEITRAEWNTAWRNNPRLTNDWPESIIFQEDFQTGPQALVERLKHIYEFPPSGAGSHRRFTHSRTTLEQLTKLVSPEQESPEPIPSDIKRLRDLEQSVYRETKNRFPAFGENQLVYNGHPGTGKTFRLLQIGYDHAAAGSRVLYLCFNKVLAADIRRMLISRKYTKDQLNLIDETRESFTFDVMDIWDALRHRLSEQGLSTDSGDLDDRGREAVELLETVGDEIATYDTVLLDETQDFKEWQFRLARLHLKKKGTFLVAYGRGQELYPTDSDIDEVLEEYPKQSLRRNFRNTKESFRAAYVAYTSQLNSEKIKASSKRFVSDFSGKEQGVDFERTEGRYPILEPINLSELDQEDPSTAFYVEQEEALLAAAYSKLIREQIDFLEERHRPIDLLLLVPSDKSLETRAARRALQAIEQDFVDLTDDLNRRVTVGADSVRLCTFHSARGIEGYRVLIFGLASLPSLCEKIGLDRPENLLYVVLTRAVFETTVVVRSDEWNSEIIVFLEGVISHLTSRNSANQSES